MKKLIVLIPILIAIITGGFLLIKQNDNAQAHLNGFDPGNIISDYVMSNKNSMSVNGIQNFLNGKVSYCNSGYTCLKDYTENGKKASQIIYDVGQQYSINPQVLIVTLQKENSLITSTAPSSSNYRTATGFGCPDTADCDTKYFGFTNQLKSAAKLFREVLDGGWSNYPVGVNYVYYNPDKSCGGKEINIRNRATSSLYRYTPYQPNPAAIANHPGTVHCGAYGNRNFYHFFTEWFGDTRALPGKCDSKVSGVSCVWRLTDQNGSELLTISETERDNAIKNLGWAYQDLIYYAYSKNVSDTIPVYRINLQNSEHFFTADKGERDILLRSSGNVDEGIAFYVLPGNETSQHTYPIFRYLGPGGHFLVPNGSLKNSMAKQGSYQYEGIAFNTPSGMATAPTPPTGRKNIYRLLNHEHMYTTDLTERDALIRSGWINEGTLTTAPIDKNSTPIYRLNKHEHIFTASATEKASLIKSGWNDEGIGWYSDDKTPRVYRFQGKNDHFYTADLDGAVRITNLNWAYEGVAFGQNQDADVPVYRVASSKDHLLTSDVNELLRIVNKGWSYEGIAFYGNKNNSGRPVYRLNKSEHMYTVNEVEKNALVKSGWIYEGEAFYVNKTNTGIPIYRLNKHEHLFTADEVEKAVLIKASWSNEGVGWYVNKRYN